MKFTIELEPDPQDALGWAATIRGGPLNDHYACATSGPVGALAELGKTIRYHLEAAKVGHGKLAEEGV